nr:hypothetical protein [uncultured bacterium]
MISVELLFSGPAQPGATLGPLTGHAETAASGGGFLATLALIEGLVDKQTPVDRLAVGDFERLVAALHREVWGAEVECQADCSACDRGFGFTVPLETVTPAAPADPDTARQLATTGEVPGPGTSTLSAPRIADLLRCDRAALIAACCHGGTRHADDEAIERALAEAFPTGADDIAAECPECGAAQVLAFDLCLHVAELLEIERPYLLREVHELADRYHWSLGEILSLRRTDRRALVRLVLDARAHERARWLK